MFFKQKKSLNIFNLWLIRLSFLAIGFLLLALLLGVRVPDSEAAGNIILRGYAWSDNIGWISFDCANNNSCDTSNYRVEINAGYFQGYAWSDNIGWISFGSDDVSGCPSAGSCRATFNASTGDIDGWARVISCKDNPDLTACGGWDGWVSLSGSNPDYGVSVNLVTGKLEGYAWSDLVVGWIDFNDFSILEGRVGPGSGCGGSVSCGGVYIKTEDASYVELRANNSIESINISAGELVTLTWEMNNVAPESCSKSSVPSDPYWNGPVLASNNSYDVSPTQTTTYILTCQGGISDSVVINVVEEEELPPSPSCGDGNIDSDEQCDPPDGTTCDDNCQFIPPPLPAVKSFSISANPSMSITILNEQGETCASGAGNNTSMITVLSFGGFSEDVSLSITDWGKLNNYLFTGDDGTYPTSGYNFKPNPLTSSNYGDGSEFDVCIKPNTPRGKYKVDIKGSNPTETKNSFTNIIINVLTTDPTWKEI